MLCIIFNCFFIVVLISVISISFGISMLIYFELSNEVMLLIYLLMLYYGEF